jgi:hypothetical protein
MNNLLQRYGADVPGDRLIRCHPESSEIRQLGENFFYVILNEVKDLKPIKSNYCVELLDQLVSKLRVGT